MSWCPHQYAYNLCVEMTVKQIQQNNDARAHNTTQHETREEGEKNPHS